MNRTSLSKTLISLARLRRVKYGRFWLLTGRREIGAEIRELLENTGDLATLVPSANFGDTTTIRFRFMGQHGAQTRDVRGNEIPNGTGNPTGPTRRSD